MNPTVNIMYSHGTPSQLIVVSDENTNIVELIALSHGVPPIFIRLTPDRLTELIELLRSHQ